MKTTGKYEVGGNGLCYTVSRQVRLKENVSAREWWETRVGRALNSKPTGRVRVWTDEKEAQRFADKLNKIYK